MQNVIVAAPISKGFQQFLIQKNCNLIFDFTNEIHLALAHGIITSTKLIIDKKFIDQAKQLQWIARLGSGLEIIDLQYAKEKNIYCFSSPTGIANAVAEHTIAFIIALQKNMMHSYQQIQNFEWIREPNRGHELEHKTIGIIGFGNTGQALAKKLQAFNAQIIYFDKYKRSSTDLASPVSLEQLYQQADIVSYHVPLNTETENYYQAKNFIKPHILINTSRGKVVATQEILKGFESKKIVAAGLDVLDFENETPFNENNQKLLQQLMQYHCLITPHIAGYTFEAIEKMSIELQTQLQLYNIL